MILREIRANVKIWTHQTSSCASIDCLSTHQLFLRPIYIIIFESAADALQILAPHLDHRQLES